MSPIYFNNAAAARCSSATINAITQYVSLEARIGPLQAAEMAAARVEQLRTDIGKLIGASADEIAFATSGASAFGNAFAALKPLQRGDRVLVGRQEWGGNLATIERAAQRVGASVEVIPCDAEQRVDVQALHAMLDARVKLISLTWLPANSGLVNDAAAIGRVARAAGITYFVDAAQALGHVPIDVYEVGCDVLVGPGRKHLGGPRGTAILYVRCDFAGQLDPAWVDVSSAPWRSDRFELVGSARRVECDGSSIALLCGLGYAVREALDEGMQARFEKIAHCADRLRAGLAELAGVVVLDPASAVRSGIVSFNLPQVDAADVAANLARQDIIVSAHPLAYTPLDMQARGLRSLVRASVSSTTSEAEITALLAAIGRMR